MDWSKEAFIFSESAKEAEWDKAIKGHLHSKGKYKKVCIALLFEIMSLIMYC